MMGKKIFKDGIEIVEFSEYDTINLRVFFRWNYRNMAFCDTFDTLSKQKQKDWLDSARMKVFEQIKKMENPQ